MRPRAQEGLSSFQLARVTGTGPDQIDRTYGHLLNDADETLMRPSPPSTREAPRTMDASWTQEARDR